MHRRTKRGDPVRKDATCKFCQRGIHHLATWSPDYWIHSDSNVNPCNRGGRYSPEEVATPQEDRHGRSR